MKPIRVQRKRTKGWRMPDNTKSVTRPCKFGNPYKIGDRCIWGIVTRGQLSLIDRLIQKNGSATYKTNQDLVDGFREKVKASQAFQRVIKRELKGKNLACFCPLDQPCHADVLLEIANQ